MIEKAIIEYLKKEYDYETRILVKEVKQMTENYELMVTYAGCEAKKMLEDILDKEDLLNQLARLGLEEVNWDEVGEGILNNYKEEWQ